MFSIQHSHQDGTATDIDKRDAKSRQDISKRDTRIILGISAACLLGLIFIGWLLLPLSKNIVPFVAITALPLFTLIAILYQAVVYNRQWGVMQESLIKTDKIIEKMQSQIEASDKALQASQRAYVGVRKEPRLNLQLGENPEIDVYFVNTGRTPAHVVEFIYKFSSWIDSENFREYRGVKNDFFIYAGTPKRVHCVWNNLPISSEWLKQIANRESQIFLVGRLAYEDVWGMESGIDGDVIRFQYFSLGIDKMREAYKGDKDYDEPEFIVELSEDGTDESTSDDPGPDEPEDYGSHNPFEI